MLVVLVMLTVSVVWGVWKTFPRKREAEGIETFGTICGSRIVLWSVEVVGVVD